MLEISLYWIFRVSFDALLFDVPLETQSSDEMKLSFFSNRLENKVKSIKTLLDGNLDGPFQWNSLSLSSAVFCSFWLLYKWIWITIHLSKKLYFYSNFEFISGRKSEQMQKKDTCNVTAFEMVKTDAMTMDGKFQLKI